MKEMIQIFGLLMMCLLTGCMKSEPGMNEKLRVYEIHSKRQLKKYNLKKINLYQGETKDKLELLAIGFETKRPLTIDSSRVLLVEGVKDFHQKINSSKELSVFLNKIPFPIDQISYSISVSDKNDRWPLFPNGLDEKKHVSYVSMRKGIVRYLIDVDPNSLLVEVYREPFEEAVRIVTDEEND